MRLKVSLQTKSLSFIPFNYQFQLHSAIYNLIRKSSKEYSNFLHYTGFIDENKHLKLFVFSKLLFHNVKRISKGFDQVRKFTFYFSTPIPKSFEHLILGIFSDQKMVLNVAGRKNVFNFEFVETLPEPVFKSEMKFTCLSPIAVAGGSEEYSGKHYFDYLNPDEREQYIAGVKNNLIRKYRTVYGQDFTGGDVFDFGFDPLYIAKRQGKIRKNIRFKDSRIIAMEAPFTIKADPELIKIGYDCGFGENNSAGFGMVEVVKSKKAKSKK